MPKVKEITTTVEDEVIFMVDPTVEFVSLVKYGANRAPFKVIKNEKKEESNMNKVVQSVLVRNDLSDENITKAMEGIDKREEKKFSTFTAYPQVSIHKCNEESLIVQKHDEIDGVYLVLGDLAEGTGESGTLQIDVKEAVDYATMDNLYSELYAMADVVGGAMRQENADADFRKTTILTTIDNFRAFAEVVLETLAEKAIAAGVDVANHPKLVVDILNAPEKKEEESDEERKAREEAEAKAKAEADAAAGDDDSTGNVLDFNAVVTQFNESLNNFGTQLVESLAASTKEVAESNEQTVKAVSKVVEKLEEIQNTTVAVKTEKSEEDSDDTASTMSQSDKLFKGSFFRTMSDFR